MPKIAYVDSSMNVRVAEPYGSDSRILSAPEGLHTWPVWSPRGDRLVFSGFSSGGNGRGLLALYLHDLGDGPAAQIYANEPGTDGLAGATPHTTPSGRPTAPPWRSSPGPGRVA